MEDKKKIKGAYSPLGQYIINSIGKGIGTVIGEEGVKKVKAINEHPNTQKIKTAGGILSKSVEVPSVGGLTAVALATKLIASKGIDEKGLIANIEECFKIAEDVNNNTKRTTISSVIEDIIEKNTGNPER